VNGNRRRENRDWHFFLILRLEVLIIPPESPKETQSKLIFIPAKKKFLVAATKTKEGGITWPAMVKPFRLFA